MINTIKNLQINEINYLFKLKKIKIKSKRNKIFKNSYIDLYNTTFKSSKNLYNIYNYKKFIRNSSNIGLQVLLNFYLNTNINKWKKKFKKIKINSFKLNNLNKYNVYNMMFNYNNNNLNINSVYLFYTNISHNIVYDDFEYKIDYINLIDIYFYFFRLIYLFYIKSLINYCFYKNINHVHLR